MWTSLVIAYDTVGGADTLKLYADGVEVAYIGDTSPPSTTGQFLLGASQVNGAVGNYLTGQLADVQVWDSLAILVQPRSPGSVFVPVDPVRIMDTRSATTDRSGNRPGRLRQHHRAANRWHHHQRS